MKAVRCVSAQGGCPGQALRCLWRAVGSRRPGRGPFPPCSLALLGVSYCPLPLAVVAPLSHCRELLMGPEVWSHGGRTPSQWLHALQRVAGAPPGPSCSVPTPSRTARGPDGICCPHPGLPAHATTSEKGLVGPAGPWLLSPAAAWGLTGAAGLASLGCWQGTRLRSPHTAQHPSRAA